jgi:8-hydroxy-5-deazaflavin:NADPH oxidoreductase
VRIGVIGAANIGSAFAKRLGGAGHEVASTAQDVAHAERAAQGAGGSVRAVPHAEIGAGSDEPILATPYAAAADALRGAGEVSGNTVVDVTNPLCAHMSGLTVGFTSATEEIQRAAPGARVVNAFDTIFAQILGGDRAHEPYAGDAGAKDAVRALIERAGFEAVDAGSLANAHYVDPLGMPNICLGYVAERGTGHAPAWVPASERA